jgi:SAM-dependent methyltransferase
MNLRDHWEAVYERKAPDAVSWYRPHLERSLAFVEAAALAPGAPIIDVGGGASTLVDDLVERGFTNVTVLDISSSAIEAARRRLGERSHLVRWVVGDVSEIGFAPGVYEFWHDRAVFHFLRDQSARRRYVAKVRDAVKPGGWVLAATFGPNGPSECSGLDVTRYDADELYAEFGTDFERIDTAVEIHRTPWGAEQEFVYCCCRRRDTV